jgi:hypothetical protein
MFRANSEDGHRRLRTPVRSQKPPCLETPARTRACEVLDFSTFDGDAERERQICDLRIRGKTEAEVCQMLGCSVPDIHWALDRAAQAAMTPAARVRSIYIDAARLERIYRFFFRWLGALTTRRR